jgi:hypothetical protein
MLHEMECTPEPDCLCPECSKLVLKQPCYKGGEFCLRYCHLDDHCPALDLPVKQEELARKKQFTNKILGELEQYLMAPAEDWLPEYNENALLDILNNIENEVKAILASNNHNRE